MICRYCKKLLPDQSLFCNYCGKKQVRDAAPKGRGNGQGSVYKLPNGKWQAQVTISSYTTEDGKIHHKTNRANFNTKTEAIKALPALRVIKEKKKESITFGELYEKWLPTHKAGKSTLDCYKAAYKYLSDIKFMKMDDIDIDDLQEAIDTCGKGKRTQENIRCVIGLVYKYGIPRHAVPNNLQLGEFLTVNADGSAAHRDSFNDVDLEKIKGQIGKVWGADYVYCLCYLGYRPSEFLSIRKADFNITENYIRGGAKTDAGKDRVVTISPKILPYMKTMYHRSQGECLVCDKDGKSYELKPFTETVFYKVLEGAGIDNPLVEIDGGIQRHKYTPHSCRHTFSTLMKRVQASDKDKLELIGHTSSEMLRYYQDVDLSDLRKITDAI